MAYGCREKQVFTHCYTGALIPSMGSPVPAPTVLAVVHCPLQLQVQTSSYVDEPPLLQLNSQPPPFSVPAPKEVLQECQSTEAIPILSLEATFLSLSDDGRLWQWVMSEDTSASEAAHSNGSNYVLTSPGVYSTTKTSLDSASSGEGGSQALHSTSNGLNPEPVFKVCPWALTG